MKGRRILAFRPGALGDTLLALPAVAALREAVGRSGSVELVGTEPFLRLAESPRHASAVHAIDRARFGALFHEGAADEELLRFLEPFQLVVAWSNLPLLARKLERLGIERVEAPPSPPPGVHAADHLYRALAALGIRGRTPLPELVLDGESRSSARRVLERLGLPPGRFVAIHPSSGSPRKNWRPEGFRALAERVLRERLKLLWVEGEADGDVVPPLEARVAAPVARSLPLPVLGAVLAEARVFVGNDSGVTHLAAAAQAPTVAVFGPTDPRSWAPRGRSVMVVDFGITVDEVWGKAAELSRGR